MNAIIFAGPTLPPRDRPRDPTLVWRPPVRQGELYRAACEGPAIIASQMSPQRFDHCLPPIRQKLESSRVRAPSHLKKSLHLRLRLFRTDTGP